MVFYVIRRKVAFFIICNRRNIYLRWSNGTKARRNDSPLHSTYHLTSQCLILLRIVV